MTDKPKLLWHADGEGKCHPHCEQAESFVQDASGEAWIPCLALRRLLPLMERRRNGSQCPFAVLADVLCLHERKPDGKLNQDWLSMSGPWCWRVVVEVVPVENTP